MKIKSNLGHNVSFYSATMPKQYMTVPAGATLELDDKVWIAEYAKAAAPAISSQALTILKQPVTQLTAKEIASTIKSEAGVAVDPSKSKAELQDLSVKLGLDLSKFEK